MDGTRDKPPGKAAENWSRKDGIRAGAVSGPWRSGDRPGAGARPAAPVAPAPVPEPHRRVPDAEPIDRAPTLRAAPVPEAPPKPAALAPSGERAPLDAAASPAERPAERSAEPAAGVAALRRWILFGVLAALGIIALAVAFRPAHAPSVPSGATATAPAAPPPTAAAATSVSDPQASDPAVSVHVRTGPGLAAGRRAEIVAVLEAAGYPNAVVTEMPFGIVRSRIGYFRAEDRPAAEALAKAVAPLADDTGGAFELRDYRALVPEPTPGRLDLWIKS